MTACCVSGYRPLRDIRPDEATWPPVLAPAGPWEICDCAEGDVVRRMRENGSGTVADGLVQPDPKIGSICQPTECALHCSTCGDAIHAGEIKWSEQWNAYLCAECGALLAEEKVDG